MTIEAPTHGFIAIVNMAGYLPESEPYVCTSFSEAKSYMLDELARDADNASELLSCLPDAEESDRANLADLLEATADLQADNGPEWSAMVTYRSGWLSYSISEVFDLALEDWETQ